MRCDMCFKEKPSLQPPLPKFVAMVCKGCFYEIDRVVGFLAHYGVTTVMIEPALPFKPPKPPKEQKSKSEQLKMGEDSTTPF